MHVLPNASSLRWLPVLSVLALAPAACSSSGGGDNNPPVDAGADTGPTGMTVEVACTDAIDAIYADPGALPAARGALIKCAFEKSMSRTELEGVAKTIGYVGKPLTSGANIYRVLYRTERGTEPATPGYSSAKVFLPDTPQSGKLPVIVASHGSRGQAGNCAPSKDDPAAASVSPDFQAATYLVAGQGVPVIAPDWAGYANFGAKDNPPSGYAATADVAKSTLDAARVMRKLIPSALNDKLVLTGHSQGGHTALSALSLAEKDGADVAVSAVVLYSPLWLSQRSWGALFLLADTYPIKTSPVPTAVSVWYHYTHSELLDGPGHGVDLFAASKRDAIKKFVEKDCWSDNYPDLEALGTNAKDLFDPAFQEAIKIPAAFGDACPADEPGKSLCTKWLARYAADRPHFGDVSKKVPMLVVYGLKDTTIPPDRATCAFERLKTDGMSTTYCVEPDGTHGSPVRTKAGYAVDWLLSKTTGAAAPAACALDEKAIVDGSGKAVTCATPPPND